ncbi:MAG: ATP-binding protein [Alphaproteobacteria bacterium]|jgi:katanin p60 ATPase-containing subunit A1|nr:ATP-binding protein [Alphaproteobacteria bacterium]
MNQQGPDALLKSMDRMIAEANTRMQAGKVLDASRSYKKAAQFAEQVVEMVDDDGERRTLTIKANEFRLRAKSLETTGRVDGARIKPSDMPLDEVAYSDEDSDLQEQQILLLIDDTPRTIEWDSIGGLRDLKEELKFHYGLAMAKIPEGMDVEGWRNIMFYGPPGTGKTLMACAIANKLNATFFNVKSSQIVSKWVGDSGKLISTLYRVARKFTNDGRPSIIFIDEFDALCKSRGAEGQLHHQQMLAAILSEIDGFAQKGRRNLVMTIGATNRPWDLDAAVLSRFERRTLISLPDEAARAEIFRIHLEAKGLPVDHRSLSYDKLATQSERLTGREVARLCKEVTARMLAEMNPDIPALVDEGLKSIQAYEIQTRPLKHSDFAPSLDNLVADTTVEDVHHYADWGTQIKDSAD